MRVVYHTKFYGKENWYFSLRLLIFKEEIIPVKYFNKIVKMELSININVKRITLLDGGKYYIIKEYLGTDKTSYIDNESLNKLFKLK